MEDPTNLLAVLLAAVAAMAIGGLWYGLLFGKSWMNMMGYTPESMRAMKLSPAAAMGIQAVLALLMMYVLAHGIIFGIAFTGIGGIEGGVMGAFWYWLGFVVPLTAAPFLFENKTWKLWAFNAAYYFVTLMVGGAIIGALP